MTIHTHLIAYKTENRKDDSLKKALLISVFSFVLFLVAVNQLTTSFGLTLCLFSFLLYVLRLGKSIPVLELMLLMASLQWILGPYIAYRLEFSHFKYIMYVDEDVYMSIVVPGYFSLLMGVIILYPRHNLIKIEQALREIATRHAHLAYYLIFIGIFIPLIGSILPPSLRFMVYLLANLKFVGVAFVLFKENSSGKWKVFFLVVGLTLLSSLQSALFHDFFLWTALLISFVAINYKLSNFQKVLVMAAGFGFAFLLQGIKPEYRYIINQAEFSVGEKVAVFVDLLVGGTNYSTEPGSDSYLGMINVRLNQGWIISAIINNVPEYEPYANGETIWEAVESSILPRFLAPEKKRAGGQENFRKFTGLMISSGTSMGTSIIGEAYGNFGKTGSWIFMLMWGMLLAVSLKVLFRYGAKHPIIFVFIPLIFLQVIKAETELYVVFNHLVKSTIFVFGFLWAARKFWGWKV